MASTGHALPRRLHIVQELRQPQPREPQLAIECRQDLGVVAIRLSGSFSHTVPSAKGRPGAAFADNIKRACYFLSASFTSPTAL